MRALERAVLAVMVGGLAFASTVQAQDLDLSINVVFTGWDSDADQIDTDKGANGQLSVGGGGYFTATDPNPYGVGGHVHYTLPKLRFGGGVGIGNGGFDNAETEFGVGATVDYRAWSALDRSSHVTITGGLGRFSAGDGNSLSVPLRAVFDYDATERVELYGGAGANYARFSQGGSSFSTTDPSLVLGANLRCDPGTFTGGLQAIKFESQTVWTLAVSYELKFN